MGTFYEGNMQAGFGNTDQYRVWEILKYITQSATTAE